MPEPTREQLLSSLSTYQGCLDEHPHSDPSYPTRMSQEGYQQYLDTVKGEGHESGGYAWMGEPGGGQGPGYLFQGPQHEYHTTGQDDSTWLSGQLGYGPEQPYGDPPGSGLIESIAAYPITHQRPHYGTFMPAPGYGQGGDYGQGSEFEIHTADIGTSKPRSLFGGFGVTSMPVYSGQAANTPTAGGPILPYLQSLGSPGGAGDISNVFFG